MNLIALKFCRFKDEKNEWRIEGCPQKKQFGQSLSFQDINLIVGKNASGKSRTIDAIRLIADLFCNDTKISSLVSLGLGTGEYDLQFTDEGSLIQYYLDFKNGKVTQETLFVDGVEKLNRKKGKLWYEGANDTLDFQTDEDVLAISKRDQKQHSFFEQLYHWGKNLSHYRFGRQLGKNTLLRDLNSVDDKDVNLKDSDFVAEIFIKGNRNFPEKFKKSILSDMKCIFYDLKEISTSSLKYFPVPVYGINVQEKDLDDLTDQREMSQGMFRALSLLIQLNYSLLSKIPSCILIDDIGEGLDYDRSKSLIELIINKVKDSAIQVIMTTNDRFVMNKIPLKYWSVIQRVSGKSIFYNYENSKKTFDEFKYTGLNNFDFLSSDFYITGFNQSANE